MITLKCFYSGATANYVRRCKGLNRDDVLLPCDGKRSFLLWSGISLGDSSASQKLGGFSILLKDTSALWIITNTGSYLVEG